MILVNANTLSSLSIGRCGENLARQVVFDVSDWETEYGPGVVELIAQRPGDKNPYPVAVKRDGTQVIWDITSVDTAIATHEKPGKCELRYYVCDVLAKSKTWRLWVDPAMDTPSETAPPEPEKGWVDQVVAVGAAAKASADSAKADADRAAALAAEVAEKAAQTAQDAETAAKAKEAAQTAQRLAEDAQRAAETAKQAAETAQSAAAQSATDAATAKQGAEAALKSAQDAAESAAQALTDIQALYQQVQALAQGAIQVINEAGSAAVQSVQSTGDAQVQRVTAEGTTQTANAKTQADAAAQSAAGAAQSAQQAADSAAVYDEVVADVNQLKSDIVTKADKTDLAKTDRSLDALWKLNQGISYQFETDDTSAYQKTVPTGAKLASVGAVGGKTVAWNQYVETPRNETVRKEFGPSIVSIDNGIIQMTPTGTDDYVSFGCISDFRRRSGRKYYLRYSVKSEAWSMESSYAGLPIIQGLWAMTAAVDRNTTDWQTKSAIIDGGSADGTGVTVFSFRKYAEETNSPVYVRDIVVVDLTLMFGLGNEPTSTDDPRITWIEQYAADHPEYNEGELVSADVDSVKYNDDVVAEIPEAVRNLPGYGWSAGDVHNSIERTETGWQYVQRVGYKDLGSIQWEQGGSKNKTSWCPKTWRENVKPTKNIYTRANIICSKYTCDYSDNVEKQAHDKTIAVNTNSWIYIYDSDYISATPTEFRDSLNGVMFYYELKEPIITDITDLMDGVLDAIPVETGGTMTFENAAQLPVPSSVEYLISLAEVGA